MPRLDLVFAEVTEKNVEQLRLMNTLIFPVRYNDQFYKDVYKNIKLAQFGAPLPARLAGPPGRPLGPAARAARSASPCAPTPRRLSASPQPGWLPLSLADAPAV
eukprot:COSAG06_NODE_4298_length_4386_cov_3.621414_2_plen_104_part_00